jgi:EmrB/QacA subfamily drug resistance transporter
MNQKVAVGVVFVAAMFMSIMDVTIVNVALPTIGREFGVPATSVAGVSIAFLVSLAVFIPASGWLGDRYGGKRVLLCAIVIFTVASALCGLASSLSELVFFRVLQGVGGGMLVPVGMAMLYRTFPPEERVRASAILTFPTTLAPALGPVLGGLLVTSLSWRWVFYVNVPIGAAAFIFGLLFLVGGTEHRPGPFDLYGFVLAGGGLGLLMYGVSEGPISGWDNGRNLAAMAVGATALGGMVLVELRQAHPLIDLRLFLNRLFRACNGVIVLGFGGFLGALYIVTLYYQDGRGLSALAAGLSTFPEALGVMGGAQLASRFIYPSIGPRRHITGGLVGMALILSLMALAATENSSLWWMRGLMFLLGLCMAQIMIPTQAAAFATISPAATGRASTLFNAIRQLGGAAGVALFTTVIVAVDPVQESGGHSVPHVAAYRVAFLVAAAVALAAIPSALSVRDADAAATIRPRRVRGRPAAVVTGPDPAPG